MYNGTLELPIPNKPMKNGSFYKYQADDLAGSVTIYTTYSPNDVTYSDVTANTENSFIDNWQTLQNSFKIYTLADIQQLTLLSMGKLSSFPLSI